MRYWIRWVDPSEDYRPLTYPPRTEILGWWCTGYDGNGNAVICAAVEAADDNAAFSALRSEVPLANRLLDALDRAES